ncbi:CPP1-like family protein [Chroococcidiopsis sp. CCMEE 29]|uniref:CPP1-like family protein n=1 Tax=Chroococcidiopsis sp. CCMEE 29 TaxID=155894 RepID=UPI002021F8CF|nr:CPP1-like family protein [Chroococcidiopsis sp. CCMEE 29]
MSDQNPYDKLGVTEDASFDEIQDARTRLVQQYDGDPQRVEAVEAAYDTILMERLRMRQEGKIRVPEGIRFAERLAQSVPKESPAPAIQSPSWLQELRDTPSLKEILLPGSVFLGLGVLSVFYTAAGVQVLQFGLIVGVGISLYCLKRKEQKFGRAVLLTGLGLITGLLAGGLFGNLLQPQLFSIGLTPEQFSTALTFLLLWLISSFLR